MKKQITFGIVAVVLGAWAILPDPLPIFIDDVVAALGCAASLLGMIIAFAKKNFA